VLLLIIELGIWGSGENWHLYYKLRQAYGDQRLLHEAPGHLFLEYEVEELASFLQIAMLVLVQPEMERGRSPLMTIPPLRQDYCSSTVSVRLNFRTAVVEAERSLTAAQTDTARRISPRAADGVRRDSCRVFLGSDEQFSSDQPTYRSLGRTL
jgi:hypothetical protein